MDMQMYRWPGFELQLLRELQRQQNSNLFCDTLLQSEGVSVPTHSCVLAAFSPYLYQKLSSTPSPPAGQKRQLSLQAIKPRTLLKLVGLLYSGRLVVRGHAEQDDVLATARCFGLTKLVEGHDDQMRDEEEEEEEEKGGLISGRCSCPSVCVQDAQVQAELSERWRRSCVSTATQTDDGDETVEYQVKHSTPPAAVSPQQHGVQAEERFGPDGLPITCDDSAASPHPVGSFHSNSVTELKESFQSGDGDRAGLVAGGGDGGVEERGRNKVGNSKRDEGAEEELMKSVATVKLSETTHISVKVKLRRRTQGEVWEVVGMHTQDEKLSAHRSLKQDRSSQMSPQRELLSHALHKPSETPCLPPANVNGPDRSEQLGSGSRPLTERSPGSDSEDQASVEESDEQIQKLLEDVMMGLNILPSLERGCRKPQPADTGFHYGFESPNLLSCTGLSNGQSPAQIRGGDSTSSRNTSSSQQQTSLHPEEQDLVLTTDFFSSGQKRGYSASGQAFRQGILDPFPLPNRNNLGESFSSSCVDDLHLLPCISPMAPSCMSAAKHPDSDPQPKLQRHPWIKEEPDLLQFPLGTMTNAHSKYSPQDACAPSCSVTCVDDVGSTAAVKLQSKTTTNGSNSKRHGTKVCDVEPRRRTRKRWSRWQHADCGVLACEESKSNDRKKSVCLVNLSSNNVLVSHKESFPRPLEKPEECLRETKTGPADPSTGWTRIRTRGFVRRAQELGNSTLTEPFLSIPLDHREDVVKKRDPSLPKRGRGRPRKVKLEVNLPDRLPVVIKTERVDVGPEDPRADGSLRDTPDAETKREKFRKRRKKINKVEEIPLKRITRSVSTDVAVPDDEGRGNPETNGESQKITDSWVDEGKSFSEPDTAWSRNQQDGLTSSSQQTSVDDEGCSKSSSSLCGSESTREQTGRRESPAAAEQEISRVNGGSDIVSDVAAADRCSQLKEDEEATLPPPPEAEVIQMTTCSIQGDGEDVEVDVLLCSPDKTPIRECKHMLLGMDVIPDKEEEEEEEEEEVDVTGD